MDMAPLTPESEASDSCLKRLSESVSSESPSAKVPRIENADPSDQRKLEREAREQEKRAEKERKEAERRAEKERKEAERKAEKERKEAERKAEKEKRDAEKKAEKERREAEKLAEKERKEAEKLAEKERKDAEKLAEKERKEAEKLAEKERKKQNELKAQPKINLFFKKSEPSSQPSEVAVKQEDTNDEDSVSSKDYRAEILPFHVKLGGTLYSSVSNYRAESDEYTEDPLAWLRRMDARKPTKREPSLLTGTEFQRQLALVQESSEIESLLQRLRIRRLQFSRLSSRHIEDPSLPVNEEFRPPYIGSTKDLPDASRRALAVNPFRTDLDDSLAYEYDSEAEWDHEDGEDLRDEDGDDSDEDGEDTEELKEFLSSDDDDTNSRRRFVGPLTPTVLWNDPAGFENFAIQLLTGLQLDPAHPYGTTSIDLKSSQDPAVPVSGISSIEAIAAKVGFDALKASVSQVVGSQATKAFHIELMKQQLRGLTEKEIRSVFDSATSRQGKKKAEKIWVLKPEASEFFGLQSDMSTPIEGSHFMVQPKLVPPLVLSQNGITPSPQIEPHH